MKIKIGPYVKWWGPYQIADLLQYVGVSEDSCHKIGDSMPEWVTKVCEWIHSKRERSIKIRIDKYDTWNMNDTLAMIILPILKQLKETKHGSPMVDLEDVPEELRGHGTAEDGDYQLHLDFGEEAKNQFEEAAWGALHTRWDWVLNEMIWTFSQLNTDWEEPFHSGVTDITFEHIEGTNYSKMVRGPNDTHHFDYEAWEKHTKRMQRGFELYGKYYQHLWD